MRLGTAQANASWGPPPWAFPRAAPVPIPVADPFPRAGASGPGARQSVNGPAAQPRDAAQREPHCPHAGTGLQRCQDAAAVERCEAGQCAWPAGTGVVHPGHHGRWSQRAPFTGTAGRQERGTGRRAALSNDEGFKARDRPALRSHLAVPWPKRKHACTRRSGLRRSRWVPRA